MFFFGFLAISGLKFQLSKDIVSLKLYALENFHVTVPLSKIFSPLDGVPASEMTREQIEGHVRRLQVRSGQEVTGQVWSGG